LRIDAATPLGQRAMNKSSNAIRKKPDVAKPRANSEKKKRKVIIDSESDDDDTPLVNFLRGRVVLIRRPSGR